MNNIFYSLTIMSKMTLGIIVDKYYYVLVFYLITITPDSGFQKIF